MFVSGLDSCASVVVTYLIVLFWLFLSLVVIFCCRVGLVVIV